MNVLETIEAFKDGLMWIGLGALLLIAGACVFAGLRHVSRALYAQLCPAAIGVLAVAAIFATCEAQKRSGGTGTTGILPVATVANGQAVSTGGTPVVPVVVTPEEIAQGWRLENVVTNDAVSYSMPTNGVIPFSLLFRFFLRWMRGFGILTALAHSDVMLLRVPSSRVTCLANGAKDGFCNYP